MSPPDDASPPPADPGIAQQEELLTETTLPLDLVSALAGDRQLSEADRLLVDDLKAARGNMFYSDLLYAVTHQRFPPETAEGLWGRILRHKYEMSFAMQRNIRIAVASLDYLSNLTAELTSATVICEARVSDMVRIAQHDSLTGLYNHSCCYRQIEMALARHSRCGAPVSMMMLDIDDFKAINDRYGHQEGDRVLAAMGKAIAETIRATDSCCRYGGEEFAVILPATDAQEAGVLAERLRARVTQNLPAGRSVTVSIGVACCAQNTCTAQELVRQADEALYRAKAEGKNRVVVVPA
ncbi:MAG TPA: GGDEF domain-containing protein [Planctomycetota bacterium]|nr:GGDEF domain-containing protein [Planctomycetota bacterium]